jgi:hypothetical protein
MFPVIRVSISGLEPNTKYLIFVDIVPCDDYKYKFHNNEWVLSGKGELHFSGL